MTARAWLARTGIVAELLVLVVASPTAAQGGTLPVRLAGVDVYGTARFRGAEVERWYGPELTLVARVVSAAGGAAEVGDDVGEAYRRVVTGLRGRGDFAYLDLSAVAYPEADTLRVYVTVDVVERADSARRMAFAAPPADTLPDPAGLLALWSEYEQRGYRLMVRGDLSPRVESCPALHCLFGFAHDSLAPYLPRFAEEVPPRRDALRAVLRGDADPERRAAAAFLLAHDTSAQWVADALLPSLRDPAEGVRNNAMRVLMALAQRPEVAIPVEPFLRALDYPSTTDRNKAAYALLGLATRPANRPAIVRGAGRILLRMLRLEQPNNHDAAYQLLKQLSGASFGERDIAAWESWWRRAAAGAEGGSGPAPQRAIGSAFDVFPAPAR